ncbi:hypothetical protein LTR50_007099 [Elasticomyces elasticus]|nr:hypothetical protein LTR50_007099 [Elasticomyces elasticus]
MKSYTLSSLACLSFSGCDYNCHPNLGTTTASAYPTPTTNEFKYVNYNEKSDEDKGDRFIVHSAFLPFAEILQAGVDAVVDTADDTYKRWFPEEVDQPNNKSQVDGRDYVGSVYRRLLAPGATPTPQPRVTRLVHDHDDFEHECEPYDQAYMVGAEGKFHVCKPEGLIDQPMIAAPANCSHFGELVSDDMDSLSGTLIHEFMHWNEVGDKVANSVGYITDVVYGSSTCMRLAKGGSSQKTFINADSYMWMALNAYYNKVCNKKFGDPEVTKKDFDKGEARLLASREYDPAVSDGVLAGV